MEDCKTDRYACVVKFDCADEAFTYAYDNLDRGVSARCGDDGHCAVVREFDTIDKAADWLYGHGGDEGLCIRHFVGGRAADEDVVFSDLVEDEWKECE